MDPEADLVAEPLRVARYVDDPSRAAYVATPLTKHPGNDPEQDPERRTPEQPTKAIDKPAPRSGKRNAPAEAPAAPAAGGFSRGPKDSRNANDNGALEHNSPDIMVERFANLHQLSGIVA